MAKALPVPCRQNGCPKLIDPPARRCEDHQRQEYKRQDELRGSAASRGYDYRWSRLSKSVIAEEPLCRECRRSGRITVATCVDHIIPKSAGGADLRSNLQPLCDACHSAKTMRESVPRMF